MPSCRRPSGSWPTAPKGINATAVRDLGLRDAEDSRIFFAARQHGAIVMSKAHLQEILGAVWPGVIQQLVEIGMPKGSATNQ